MNVASNKETQKLTKNPGGYQEREQGVVHHVQGEHYQLSRKGFKSLSDSEWFSWQP